MHIIKIEIMNHRAIKVMDVDLNGNDMSVAGTTGAGKTTAISGLWEIIEKRGEMLQTGARKGYHKITLSDGVKTVYAKRDFTPKTNTISIVTADGETITSSEFKKWIDNISENPHKIVQMKPKDRAELLLSLVVGDGVDELNAKVESATANRQTKEHEEAYALKSVGPEPEDIAIPDSSAIIEKIKAADECNAEIQKITTKIDAINSAVIREKSLRAEKESEIEKYEAYVKRLREEIANNAEKIKGGLKFIEDTKPYLEANKIVDTTPLHAELKNIDSIRSKSLVRASWVSRNNAYNEAKLATSAARKEEVEARNAKKVFMDSVKFPVEGLSAENGDILYNNVPLENCGESEQMLICGAIAAHRIKDSVIKVVRMDGVESMSKKDFEQLSEIFHNSGIQVLSTRVSRGDVEDHEITISDGVYNNSTGKFEEPAKKTTKKVATETPSAAAVVDEEAAVAAEGHRPDPIADEPIVSTDEDLTSMAAFDDIEDFNLDEPVKNNDGFVAPPLPTYDDFENMIFGDDELPFGE